MIQDILADIFLCFNREFIVIPLIGVGYWAYRRDLFSHLLFLILLSMIVNTFLKCVFQVPLKPHLGQHGWYAFPSGHMQLSTVLYGRLWWEFRRTNWASLFLVLLGGMGWGMVWKQYHDVTDVVGGAFSAIALLLIYSIFLRVTVVRQSPEKMGLFLLPFTAFFIFLMPSLPQHMAHVWQAQGGILGFSVGASLLWRIDPSLIPSLSIKIRIFKVLVGLLGFSGLWFSNKLWLGGLSYPLYPFLSFFICGVWLSAGPDLILSFVYKKLPLKK